MIFLLKNWKLIAIGMAAIGLFFSGMYAEGKLRDAAELKLIKQMESEHIADMQEAAELIGIEAEKQQEVRYVYRDILKEVNNVGDGVCLNDSAIKLWRQSNQAASSPKADKPDD